VMLGVNHTLVDINVDYNPFGDEGAFLIAAMLKTNDRLTSISTYSRSIGVAGTLAIIAALKTNRTIIDVFPGNDITDNVGDAFADYIESNRMLKALSFHGDTWLDRHIAHFCDAVKVNQSLLSISRFGSLLHLGDDGTKSFVEMLVANCTMTRLRFEAVYQNDKQIIDALEENFSLTDVALCNYASNLVIEVAQSRIGLRNRSLLWRNVHAFIVDICMAMATFKLPAYVMLEIIDCLPFIALHVKHVNKIRLIEAVISSIRKTKLFEREIKRLRPK